MLILPAMPTSRQHSVSTRSAVLVLKSSIVGWSGTQIEDMLGVNRSTVNRIFKRAIKRGFDPNSRPLVLKDEFVVDAPRSGRPTKQSQLEKQAALEEEARTTTTTTTSASTTTTTAFTDLQTSSNHPPQSVSQSHQKN